MNQCDGCRAGMPIEGGIHRTEDGKPFMCCERNRYKVPTNKINRFEESNPILEIEIDNHRYGFTVQMLSERDKAWLLQVLPKQMQLIHNRAVEKATKDFQKQLRALAGIDDGRR